MADPSPPRRLEADARRGQLVQVGLDLVKTVPVDQMAADDIARIAGVSKGLVFHYFPTKRDLHVAILRAAAAELLAELDAGSELPPAERLAAGLEAFVRYIEQRPDSYVAMVRGAGSDEQLRAVFEATRGEVVRIIAGAIGLTELPPGLRIAIRGWIAFVEECVLHWLDGMPVPRTELIGFLQKAALVLLPDASALPATVPDARGRRRTR